MPIEIFTIKFESTKNKQHSDDKISAAEGKEKKVIAIYTSYILEGILTYSLPLEKFIFAVVFLGFLAVARFRITFSKEIKKTTQRDQIL